MVEGELCPTGFEGMQALKKRGISGAGGMPPRAGRSAAQGLRGSDLAPAERRGSGPARRVGVGRPG